MGIFRKKTEKLDKRFVRSFFRKSGDFIYFEMEEVRNGSESQIQLARRLAILEENVIYIKDMNREEKNKGDLSSAIIGPRISRLSNHELLICFYYSLGLVDAFQGALVIEDINIFRKLQDLEKTKDLHIQAVVKVSIENILAAQRARKEEKRLRELARKTILARLSPEEKEILGVY